MALGAAPVSSSWFFFGGLMLVNFLVFSALTSLFILGIVILLRKAYAYSRRLSERTGKALVYSMVALYLIVLLVLVGIDGLASRDANMDRVATGLMIILLFYCLFSALPFFVSIAGLILTLLVKRLRGWRWLPLWFVIVIALTAFLPTGLLLFFNPYSGLQDKVELIVKAIVDYLLKMFAP
jgi:hypothetical protein